MGWESYLRTFAVSLKCTGSQRNTEKKNKDRERGRNRFGDIGRIQEILQRKNVERKEVGRAEWT